MTDFRANEIKRKLYAYCAYQERCIQEVHKKLRSLEVEEKDFPSWIAHLQEENFLDEDRFARGFARGKFRYKRWGKIKIRQELRKRNIGETLIQSALRTEISTEDYRATLQKILELRKVSFPVSAQEKKKLTFYLTQKGYEWEEIRRALQVSEKRNK